MNIYKVKNSFIIQYTFLTGWWFTCICTCFHWGSNLPLEGIWCVYMVYDKLHLVLRRLVHCCFSLRQLKRILANHGLYRRKSNCAFSEICNVIQVSNYLYPWNSLFIFMQCPPPFLAKISKYMSKYQGTVQLPNFRF